MFFSLHTWINQANIQICNTSRDLWSAHSVKCSLSRTIGLIAISDVQYWFLLWFQSEMEHKKPRWNISSSSVSGERISMPIRHSDHHYGLSVDSLHYMSSNTILWNCMRYTTTNQCSVWISWLRPGVWCLTEVKGRLSQGWGWDGGMTDHTLGGYKKAYRSTTLVISEQMKFIEGTSHNPIVMSWIMSCRSSWVGFIVERLAVTDETWSWSIHAVLKKRSLIAWELAYQTHDDKCHPNWSNSAFHLQSELGFPAVIWAGQDATPAPEFLGRLIYKLGAGEFTIPRFNQAVPT